MCPPRYGHQPRSAADRGASLRWASSGLLRRSIKLRLTRPRRPPCAASTLSSRSNLISAARSSIEPGAERRATWVMPRGGVEWWVLHPVQDVSQATRAISTARLHVLPRFHLPPINVLVSHGPSEARRPGSTHLGVGFPLRCFQRLSLPDVATRRCPWRNNRYTRGQSIPVLSY